MAEIFIGGASLAGVILAAVQVAKASGLPPRWAPLTASALGIALGIAASASGVADISALEGLVGGFMSGVAAVGLYSGLRNTAPPARALPPAHYPPEDGE